MKEILSIFIWSRRLKNKIRDINVFLHFLFQGGFKLFPLVMAGVDDGMKIQGHDTGFDGFNQQGKVSTRKVGPARLSDKYGITGKKVPLA